MMLGRSKLKIPDLNEHVTCVICGGYFIDATTIIECLHSFCRSCIVTHMMINRCCPKCEVPAHKTRPLLNIRSDKTLQDIVNKLVPNLLENEKSRKRRFHEETGIPVDAEVQRNDDVTLTPEKKDHSVSLSLEYDSREFKLSAESQWTKEDFHFNKRYLRCYDAVFVSTINKLVRRKLAREDLEVLSFCRGEVLPESYTLSDVASTFSWKSDRPLSLTYMTFSTKCQKRKICIAPESDYVADEVPAKKLAVAPAAVCDNTPKQSVVPKLDTAVQSVPKLEPAVTKVPSETTTNTAITHDTKIVSPLRKPQSSPWKPNSEAQQTAKPIQQVTGVKVSPYAVRNLPFVNISSCNTTTTNITSPIIPQTRTLSTSSRSVPRLQSPTQTFSPFAPPQGKVKSINSIANRLQMEKVKLAPMKTESQATVNVPDSMKVHSNPNNSTFLKQSANSLRSSWVYNEPISANMKRNMMAQRVNASTFRSQGFKEDQRNTSMIRQDIRPGTSRSSGHSSAGGPSRYPAPTQGNFVRYTFPVRTNPPNYNQATDQRNSNMKMTQNRQMAARPKFHNMQRNIPLRTEQQQLQQQHQSISQQQHFSRRKNVPRVDDPQLLSTTRQLASLRQQQKLLNEIAAAVSARNSNSHSTDSIRAVMSGLSPKSSSSIRVSSQTPPTINTVRKPTPPPIRSVGRPIRPAPPMNSAGLMKALTAPGTSAAPKVNGAKSFNEVSHLSKNISYPAINKRREGGIDIYQNTIARAKAQLREMNMKDRAVHQHRTQLRAAVSPYNVQNPNATRKQSTVSYRPSLYQNYVQRGSPSLSSVASMNHQRRSNPATYRGVTTKPPPPPPHSSQRYISPGVFQNPMTNRQQRPPPIPTSHVRIPPVVKQADAGVPEQEQPLCLVVKK